MTYPSSRPRPELDDTGREFREFSGTAKLLSV